MTTNATIPKWDAMNQAFLTQSVADYRGQLEAYVSKQGDAPDPEEAYDRRLEAWPFELLPSLEHVVRMFALSPFERDLLIWAAGIELDGGFAKMFAQAHGDPHNPFPTFSLALAVLPGSHWSALSPEGPLRRWNLLIFRDTPSLTGSPIRIDERVLNYLVGVSHMDQKLLGLVRPVSGAEGLLQDHEQLVLTIAAAWSKTFDFPAVPVVQLCGSSIGTTRGVARAICRQLGLSLYIIDAGSLPHDPREMELVIRRWHRESILSEAALMLEMSSGGPPDANRNNIIDRFIENLPGFLFLASADRYPQKHRPLLSYDIDLPRMEEQHALWHSILGERDDLGKGDLMNLAVTFNMTAETIRGVCAGALGMRDAAPEGEEPPELFRALWDTARMQARPRLDDLAQRIEADADWEHLVLPADQKATLHRVVDQINHRAQVYHNWGFASRSKRGLGISALFAGPSGTGKTMAAEVLAATLDMDLYRIDLSSLISKYIGETEKNLRRIFDAAETGGSILLFDEADSLFGKRSDVKDSHDRYANIEVSYLLQRMEAFRGLAILTSNLKDALDEAFLRRLRFTIDFPFPDRETRVKIWQRIFPEGTPTRGLKPEMLARLNVAGGNIRNIAMSAAFLAARDHSPVTMKHMLEATKNEYKKLEKPLTTSEIKGWT
ncbi:MAG: ATP-binding protein [Acidobacteriota bacterium]|nr:ATP-binding protein [Acidobacteriota bacterium]